jgi:CRP/FNR family transcriptional regulator, cyclic AMP receptor protein
MLTRGYAGSHLVAMRKEATPPVALPAFPGLERRRGSFDTRAFLSTAGPGRTTLHFGKKKIIFSQGQPADAVFYIHKGSVRLSVTSTAGKEATLGILGPGDFVGEDAIHPDQPRTTSAITLTECTALKIERNEMLRALQQEQLAGIFIHFLLERNARVQEDLVDQLFNSTEKRLARALLLLAQYGKGGTDPLPVPRISQESLAAMIGTSRSRVNLFMNRFKKFGFIDYENGIKVHSSLVSVLTRD